MNVLHDPFSRARIEKIDTRRVHEAYEDWPSLAKAGFAVDFELGGRTFDRAFVLGMGGSAAGGDIIAGWLSATRGVEFWVFKGHVPISNMKGTLAIACSASGQTGETISMMKTAKARGATVVSISSGGALEEESIKRGIGHIEMPRVVAPRYMLPFIVFSCLAVVNRAMDLRCQDEAENAIASLEEASKQVAVDIPTERNQAKQLARTLISKTPVVYGSAVTRGVGIRFKNAMNENAKKHALFDTMPDLFHNGVEAWEDPSRGFFPILLRHSEEGAREKKKADALAEFLARGGRNPVQVRGKGRSGLSQLVTMAYILDMASYYTAIGLGRDPFPTPVIDRLKGVGPAT